jgi:hypothetical protein
MDPTARSARSCAAALMLLALAVILLHAEGGPSVTCQVKDDPRGRVYRLGRVEDGSGWRLSMQQRASGDKWVVLSLPKAVPQLADGTASLSFKNGNGGRQVTLDVSPSSARLDVFVDYGLDVNIEPDLDPDVDQMNTNGPITNLDCAVVPK